MASLWRTWAAGICPWDSNPVELLVANNLFSGTSTNQLDTPELEEEEQKLAELRDEGLVNEIFKRHQRKLWQKSSLHGKRQDGIVKGMLQHSRTKFWSKSSYRYRWAVRWNIYGYPIMVWERRTKVSCRFLKLYLEEGLPSINLNFPRYR